MKNSFKKIENPEIFIGIVAPVGVETESTIENISEFFRHQDYEVITIKISDYFSSIVKQLKLQNIKLEKNGTEKRIKTYIDCGNKITEAFDDNSILAAYAIFRIQNQRVKSFKRNKNIDYQKRLFIIRQFKRKEEIDLMRSVYGRLFFQVSIYAEKYARIEYLARKIAHEENKPVGELYNARASGIIAIDENQSDKDYGQRLAKIFHDADFIVRRDVTDTENFKRQIKRFCELLFSSNSISPSKMEYGMFAAKAAALRTLDLSRQVGCAIFKNTGEIVSMGSNEVPKALGGTYWCDESPYDAREFKKGEDSNDARKRELLKKIFDAAAIGGTFEQFLNKKEIKDSQFLDALEYGRIVHAEMSAITDAARNGISTRDTILYCTTFPCHMCAKHIVASGIRKVYFLEPYPKSLAFDLHSDSISFDGKHRGEYQDYQSVDFEHFYGITPRRYREFFERTMRKKNGIFQEYIDGVKRPFVDCKFPFYTELEMKIIKDGTEELQKIIE